MTSTTSWGGLDDPPLRVRLQPAGADQHLRALGGGVADRQRVGVEQEDHQRAVAMEHTLAELDARGVGPARQAGGEEVRARAGRQRGRRHVVVLDEVAHQHVDRAHDVVAAREQVEDHVVGLGVTARAQVVELLVGPAEVAHAATVRAAAAACPRAKARARALDLTPRDMWRCRASARERPSALDMGRLTRDSSPIQCRGDGWPAGDEAGE